jgi:hypothetical protein
MSRIALRLSITRTPLRPVITVVSPRFDTQSDPATSARSLYEG